MGLRVLGIRWAGVAEPAEFGQGLAVLGAVGPFLGGDDVVERGHANGDALVAQDGGAGLEAVVFAVMTGAVGQVSEDAEVPSVGPRGRDLQASQPAGVEADRELGGLVVAEPLAGCRKTLAPFTKASRRRLVQCVEPDRGAPAATERVADSRASGGSAVIRILLDVEAGVQLDHRGDQAGEVVRGAPGQAVDVAGRSLRAVRSGCDPSDEEVVDAVAVEDLDEAVNVGFGWLKPWFRRRG